MASMRDAFPAALDPAPSVDGLFADVPPRARRLLGLRWWLLALGFHLVLLALPWVPWQDRLGERPSLTVDLRIEADDAPARAPAPTPETAALQSADPPVPADSDTAGREPRPSPPTRIEKPPPDSASTTVRADPSNSAVTPSLRVEQLLESVAAMDWSPPSKSTTGIGRPTTSTFLETLGRPLLPGWDNAFDGRFAPDDVEIVDRWAQPGGIHQVVIRAPDGNTYCGRQAPLDDLRPWLQMPMLFHRCAGGGQREGSRSWRNN